ncbi:lysophospholipid acyltransferase family protein [Thermosipho ferrireducens]|nr:lysophospholipid acyltransferase family protein [Thermosipho ferrireducens]
MGTKIKNFIMTLYFLIGAVIYIFIYGAIVLVVGFIIRLFSKKAAKRFVINQVVIFGRMAFKLLGIKVYKFGDIPPVDENFLVVANHQSALDIPMILGFCAPVAFIAKKELGKLPGINWYLKYLGSVLIDRGNIRQTAVALKEVVKKMKSGTHFVIFPEGTRSRDGKMLPFKPRSLELAFRNGIKVLPVSIWGNHKILKKKSLVVHRTPAGIKIHDLVDPKEFQNEEEFRLYVENVIKNGVKEIERRLDNEESKG